MGLIEDALRSTFEAHVRNPPAVDDAAGRAIEQAARVRRRHASVAAFAAAACIALVSTGATLLAPGEGSLPPVGHSSPVNPVVPDLPMTVLNGQQLVLPSREVIELKVDGAERAWRTSDGWLVHTREPATGMASLWYLPPGGGEPALVASGRAVVVSADGRRVAWGGDNGVTVATRTHAALSEQVQTAGTGQLRPVLFAGGGVLLGTPDQDDYDIWFPERGDYHKTAGYRHPILAATPDGSRLYALSDKAYPCLVLLVPDGLRQDQNGDHTACELVLAGVTGAYPSPDGRWLAIAFPGRVELYDATTVWSEMPPVQVWYTNAYGLTWLDDQSLVVSTGQYLKRYVVDRPGQGETFVASMDGASPAPDAPWVWPVATLG